MSEDSKLETEPNLKPSESLSTSADSKQEKKPRRKTKTSNSLLASADSKLETKPKVKTSDISSISDDSKHEPKPRRKASDSLSTSADSKQEKKPRRKTKTIGILSTSADSSEPPQPSPVFSKSNIISIPFSRGKGVTTPSVSKILRETMSEENRRVLANWEARMIKELGVQGFKDYQQQTFARGHAIHSWMEQFLSTMEKPQVETKDEVTHRHIQSISNLLPSIGDVKVIESATFHSQLNYCGIIDCVARVGDTLFLIDWKTSEKAKPDIKSLYDNPLQIVAYLGALNSDPAYSSLKGLSEGAVVVLYNSGYPAVIHKLSRPSVKQLWKTWLQRLQLYNQKMENQA